MRFLMFDFDDAVNFEGHEYIPAWRGKQDDGKHLIDVYLVKGERVIQYIGSNNVYSKTRVGISTEQMKEETIKFLEDKKISVVIEDDIASILAEGVQLKSFMGNMW